MAIMKHCTGSVLILRKKNNITVRNYFFFKKKEIIKSENIECENQTVNAEMRRAIWNKF